MKMNALGKDFPEKRAENKKIISASLCGFQTC